MSRLQTIKSLLIKIKIYVVVDYMNEKIKKMQENIVPANNQNRSPFYSYDDHKSGKKFSLLVIQ